MYLAEDFSGSPAKQSLSFSMIGLGWIAISIALSGLGFFVGIPVSAATGLLAFAVSLLVIYFTLGLKIPTLIAMAAAIGVTLALSLYYGTLFLDTAADTRWYHSPAIQMLIQGWNPVADPARPLPVPAESFPKGLWILSAQIQQLTGDMRAGKGLGLFMIIVCATFSYSAISAMLRERNSAVPRWIVVSLSTILALHPIAISQLSIHYIDGQVANILVCVTMSSLAFYFTRQTLWFVCFLVCIFLAFSFKFNAAIFAVIIGLPAGWHLLTNFGKYKFLWGAMISVGLLTVLANWNPYLTNLKLHGSPLYPVVAVEKSEDWALKRDYLEGVGNVHAFFIGHTSGTYQLHGNEQSLQETWVAPWSAEAFGGNSYGSPMARTLGVYGPFYPYLLFLSFAVFAYLCFTRSRVISVTAGLILISAFIQPEGWHARYTPQAGMLPALALIGLLIQFSLSSLRRFVFASTLGASILTIISAHFALKGHTDDLARSNGYIARLNALNEINSCVEKADLNSPRFSSLSVGQASAFGYDFCENGIAAKLTVSEFFKLFSEQPVLVLTDLMFLEGAIAKSVLPEDLINEVRSKVPNGEAHGLDPRSQTRVRIVAAISGNASSQFRTAVRNNLSCTEIRDANNPGLKTVLQSATNVSGAVSYADIAGTELKLANYATNLIGIRNDRLYVLAIHSSIDDGFKGLVRTYKLEQAPELTAMISSQIDSNRFQPCFQAGYGRGR